MEKKTLFNTFLTFAIAMLTMISVTFAWFTIAYDAGGEIVGTVGTLETAYDFAQIKSDGFEFEHQDGMFNDSEVIPGSSFVFTLVVSSEGNEKGLITVDLTGVNSYIVDNNNDLIEEFTDNRNKIQFAFTYSVIDVYWVPRESNISKLPQNVDQNNPLPSPEKINEMGWIQFSEDEKDLYYPTFNQNGNINSVKDEVSFCNFYESEGVYKDSTTYSLLKDVKLNEESAGDTADAKNAFIIYFRISYKNEITLPSYLDQDYEYSPDVYENQLMGIDAIMIVSKEEENK